MSKLELQRMEKVEGKVGLFVGSKEGKVIVDFGESLSGMEIGAQEAEMIGFLLLKHAASARMLAAGAKPPV
jgi:hypothetical protein